MAHRAEGDGLKTIFSLFLGLMLAVFVGVGVYTFHPPPEQFDREIQELNREEESIRGARGVDEPTTEDQDRIEEINRRRSELHDAAEEARAPWGRSTSIILIVFATLAMAVSLVRADYLPVISNGLMLGGLFTMLYGVGWIAVTDTSITRFLVITAALVITLGLGYVRFVRRAAMASVPAKESIPTDEGLVHVEQRLRDLENRMDEAALALGPRKT